MITRRNFFLTSAAFAAMAMGLSGCGGDSSGEDGAKTVRFGYVDSGASFPNELLGVAIDQGFLEENLAEAGYEVELIAFTGAGPAINEAFTSAEIDFATTGDVPSVLGKSKGIDTTLFGGQVNFQGAALVVPADSEAETIEDLAGKTVATLQGSYMHKALINMLADNGMSLDDIELTNMTSGDAATAVTSGSVDAACVATIPQAATLLAEGTAKVILNGDDSEDYNGGMYLLGLTSFVEDNPDAIAAIVKSYIEANEYALANYDSAIESLAKSGTEADALKSVYPDVVDLNLSAGEELSDNVVSVSDFLYENGLSSAEVDPADWLDASYFEAASA